MAAHSLKQRWKSALLNPEALLSSIGQSTAEPPPKLSLVEFIGLVNPRYKWSEMSRRIASVLQRVADGELTRVMIFVPPRHGKSELVSRLFSAYCLYLHPESWVCINSYSAELAHSLSRSARHNFLTAGGEISDESSAVSHWETQAGGGMWAAGVGGPITGKGFGNPHGPIGGVGIIDDPLKNAEEANSETIREKQKDWYDSTFYTRAEANAPIVILQTRWHEDDLSGWLLSKEYDDEPERWHIVSLEAICEVNKPQYPPSCTVEPDWRQPGEALNPIRYTAERLLKIQKRLSEYYWAALYQQRPRAVEGGTFKEDWFKYYVSIPSQLNQLVISVDATFKATTNSSFVVIQLWGIEFPLFYLLHQKRQRMGFVETKESIKQIVDYAELKFGSLPSATLIEDKANGPAIIDELKAHLPGIVPINPGSSSKEARAEAVSTYFMSGNVLLPDKTSLPSFSIKDYVDEFLSFPRGAANDQVDATTQLVSWAMQRYRNQQRQRRPPRSVGNW